MVHFQSKMLEIQILVIIFAKHRMASARVSAKLLRSAFMVSIFLNYYQTFLSNFVDPIIIYSLTAFIGIFIGIQDLLYLFLLYKTIIILFIIYLLNHILLIMKSILSQ